MYTHKWDCWVMSVFFWEPPDTSFSSATSSFLFNIYAAGSIIFLKCRFDHVTISYDAKWRLPAAFNLQPKFQNSAWIISGNQPLPRVEPHLCSTPLLHRHICILLLSNWCFHEVVNSVSLMLSLSGLLLLEYFPCFYSPTKTLFSISSLGALLWALLWACFNSTE